MNKSLTGLLALSFCTVVAQSSVFAAVETITAEALHERLAGNNKPTVINVLDKQHYDEKHIKDSINIPLGQLENTVADWEKDREIVVYCASYECKASETAFHKLKKLGFTNVKAYEGGTKEWFEKGYK